MSMSAAMLSLSFVGHDLARPECMLACAPNGSNPAVMATSLVAWRWGQ